MEWMNYHHLLYFWIAAREGSISAAGEVLQLSAPTVSGQINLLEEALGQKLFKRAGRGLVLTDAGKLVYRYAEEIFSLGQALQQEVKGKSQLIARRLHVGITLGVPDLLAERILQRVFKSAKEWKVVTHTGGSEDLLGLLAMRALDVLISDAPAANPKLNVWSHLLFESGTTIFTTAKASRSLKKGFPKSLTSSHFFLPAESAAVRRDLDAWFESKNARPQSSTECDDASLGASLAIANDGVFTGPTPLADDLQKRYGAVTLGRADTIRHKVYAITTERKPKVAAVAALLGQK
jgi:LysR family transcriptional regulator, transcriptional activator of nhaA